MREPDGYCRKVFGGQWDIKDLRYVDELMGHPDYKEYEPVCLVSPELLDWVEIMRTHLQSCPVDCPEYDCEKQYLNKLEMILPEKKNE